MKSILFNTEMVRAILDGRKTVTRRVLKTEKHIPDDAVFGYTGFTPKGYISCRGTFVDENGNKRYGENYIKMPYQIGNTLYVRGTWFYEEHMHDVTAGEPDLPSGRYSFRYVYKADSPDYPVDVGVGADGWKPSIHMPKEAARIFLRVTDVRVERLQDITVTGLQEEGLLPDGYIPQYVCMKITAFDDFKDVWNSTIKKSDLDKYGWNANPWVGVIEFERISKEEAYGTENKA